MTVDPTREAPPEGTSGRPQGTLLDDDQIRWLRRAVVGMTAVLVAGVIVLIGRVIYLARGSGTQAASGMSIGGQPLLLPEVTLPLPPGATIKAVSMGGSRLAVTHALPGGDDEISVLDLVTGKRVSHVTIERGK